MTYLLVVGEASADAHAAALIRALKQQDSNARFLFIGGDLMEKAAGQAPFVHYKELAMMGFIDVLRSYKKIHAIAQRLRNVMEEAHPSIVIPVDYGGFNLKYTVTYARRLGIPVVYYIPPKVWAWRRWRVRRLRKEVDLSLTIFPFEANFLVQHGVKALYVGNPTADTIFSLKKEGQTASDKDTLQPSEIQNPSISHSSIEINSKHGNSFLCDTKGVQQESNTQPLIALLPGSRTSELAQNLTPMLESLSHLPQQVCVEIAGAPGLTKDDYTPFLINYPHVILRFGTTYSLLQRATVAIVTSGTATLETALIGTPQVVCYNMRGGRMARFIFERLFPIKYFSLVNLLLEREVVPELLGDQATAKQIAQELTPLLSPQSVARQSMQKSYEQLGILLTPPTPYATAAHCAASLIFKESEQKTATRA